MAPPDSRRPLATAWKSEGAVHIRGRLGVAILVEVAREEGIAEAEVQTQLVVEEFADIFHADLVEPGDGQAVALLEGCRPPPGSAYPSRASRRTRCWDSRRPSAAHIRRSGAPWHDPGVGELQKVRVGDVPDQRGVNAIRWVCVLLGLKSRTGRSDRRPLVVAPSRFMPVITPAVVQAV